MTITDGKYHDINVVKDKQYCFPTILSDSIITVDRAYIDYKWLYSLTISKVYFVTRIKRNISYEVLGQQKIIKNRDVISDHTIRMTGFYTKENYPDKLRLIKYYDKETKKELVFITNNFKLAARTIADLYKARWQIEIFFK
ncbi:unnamed protein product, partial [marine sediment metagenome]